jgi:tetratricopeptide (TPR) repeat protein
MARQFTLDHPDHTGTPGPIARGVFVVGVVAVAVLVKACGGDSTPRIENIPQEQASTASSETSAVTTSGGTVTPQPVVSGPVSFTDAQAAYHAGRFEEAVTMFSAYTEQKPENGWGYYMLGLSQWKSGKLDEAAGSFEKALAKDATHAKSLVNSARVLLDLQRPGDALVRAQRVIQLDSTSAEGWRTVGRAFTDLDSTTQAIAAYQRALTLDDKDVWSMNNLGMIYLNAGQYEQSLRPFARAVELAPERAVFQNNLGMALERSGQPSAATLAYRAAIAADTTYKKAITSLARVEGRTEQEGVVPVDLAAMSVEFQNEIAKWKETPATVGVVKP